MISFLKVHCPCWKNKEFLLNSLRISCAVSNVMKVFFFILHFSNILISFFVYRHGNKNVTNYFFKCCFDWGLYQLDVDFNAQITGIMTPTIRKLCCSVILLHVYHIFHKTSQTIVKFYTICPNIRNNNFGVN